MPSVSRDEVGATRVEAMRDSEKLQNMSTMSLMSVVCKRKTVVMGVHAFNGNTPSHSLTKSFFSLY